MLAVDRDLNGAKIAALALATSPNLDMNDLAAFHAQTKRLLGDEFPGFTFVLSDQSGRQLVNTLRPFGQPLPPHGASDQLRRVFATGKPIVSDVFVGGVMRRPLIGIDVPVWRDGKVVYDLSVGILPERIGKVLAEQRVSADRIVAIFDTKGVIVARTHDPKKFVGQKGTARLLERMRASTEGEVDVMSVEGIPVYSVFSRSPVSGWTVAIGIPRSSVLAELLQSVAWISGVVMALLVAGFGLAWYLGGAIRRSVKALVLPAEILGAGEQMRMPSMSFREADEVAAELLRHRHHLERLVDERTRQLEKSKALLETVYATAPVGLSFIGPDLRFVAVNEYLAAINGKPVKDHVGRTLRDVIGELSDFVEQDHRRVLESGQPLLNKEVSGTLRSSPQRLGHWLVSYYPVFGPDHAILGINGVVVDISERKRAEEAINNVQRLLDETEQIGNVGGWALQCDTGALIWSKGIYSIHEVDAAFEVTVEKAIDFYTPTSRPMIEQAVRRAIGQGEAFDLELQIITAKGNAKFVHAIGKADLAQQRVTGFFQDITERQQHEAIQDETKRQLELQLAEISQLQRRLQEQVIRDSLTGLHNRRFLDETLPQELVRAKREGYCLALIMIDLDKFKRINDTYGHAAGDEVLKALSAILVKTARESDVICRYGGEEFLAALPGMLPDLALRRANEWRLELSRTPVRYGDFMINVTFSAGVAVFPDHGIDIDTLLSRADQALYRSKEEGRNQVTCFSVTADAATVS
jgi:two-component system sensor histidine kinase/response regulator